MELFTFQTATTSTFAMQTSALLAVSHCGKRFFDATPNQNVRGTTAFVLISFSG
jgi:hypothetical protein